MIKSQGKAADRSLRIYRPDISLEEICQTNGAGIVRAMIPCFRENPPFSYIYGVNVRTPRVDKILPFSTAYIYDKSRGEGKIYDKLDIKPGDIKLKVPDFTDKYNIRELFLYADIKNGKINPNDVIILSLTTDRDLKINPSKKINEIHQIKKDVCKKDGFFVKQANELGIKERAYLWVTSEDYNVNTAGDALSNIIAISDDFDAIETYIKPHRLDFINLLFLIKARYMFDTEIAQRKTAIASAKAAIMSRNMSHNLGSHVMAYLKQHLNSVQDMVRDNVLDSFIKATDDLTTPAGVQEWFDQFQNKQKGLNDVALPFLVGLGRFISYLQERQDFIATIATDYIPYFSTVNFKDFIYDELNPDKRYKRHPDRIGLKPDNILLGNIARSEGLARSTKPTENKQMQMSDIVIKYKSFDGNPVQENTPESFGLTDMRDFMISLPGGVVGRQAIFSIVENVIRNAAKHGKWGTSETEEKQELRNLELTFDRFSKEDYSKKRLPKDYVPKGELSFPDFYEKYYARAEDINDLCVVTLTDNMVFEERGAKNHKKLDSIRKALIEAYIDNSTVEMLQTNKGIKEMRISAAWMRGIEDNVKINPLYITPDFDKIPDEKKDKEDHWIHVRPKSLPANPTKKEKKDYEDFVYKYWACEDKGQWDSKKAYWVGKAPVLMVRACAQTPKEDYHLQYVFCLPKPKKVAIVLPDKKYAKFDLEKMKLFEKNAWSIFSVGRYKEEKNKSYEFILLSSGISKEDITLIKQISPKRVYTQKQIGNILKIEENTLLKFDKFKEVYIALYRKLCKFEKSDIIVISDKKVKPSKSFPENVHINEGGSSGRFIYRTHNETEQNFAAYLKTAEEETIFVEGITGNNSTDRLVRNDKIDEIWMYKHLHAMKTSVGIFDERIFSKIYKKDEADIRVSEMPIDELIKHLSSSEKSYVLKRKIGALSQLEDDKLKEEKLRDILKRDPREVLGDYISIAYQKKGLSVFNILKKENGMDIYGYDGYKWDESQTHCYSIIEKIASISYVTDESGHKKKFVITKQQNLKEEDFKFDYLSIHQGLLDKIYEMFDIRHNPLAKHEFTKAFYEAFAKDPSYLTYRDKEIESSDNKEGQEVYFLPNLRIHSGRSKPSFADMPQHQPFIQYAAIENAVLDCKYSLIELLDFARYE
jgi:hypothetical protein